jgi:peptidoglycan/LPS O-acetylase OafA/YrhL
MIYGSQLPALLLYMAAGILAATGLAILSWHVCEKHFLRAKKAFSYRRDGAPADYTSGPRRALSYLGPA